MWRAIMPAGCPHHICRMTRRSLLLLVCVALMAGSLVYARLFGPSTFERDFDQNIARFPLAASIAQRDRGLRELFLRRTEEAFDKGGWRAANGALNMSLQSEVDVYADDQHLNAVSRARLALLLRLASNPLACKSYLLAGAERGEFPEAEQELADLAVVEREATVNGFDRKMNGIPRQQPNHSEILAVEQQLSEGPFVQLTQQELAAETRYVEGNPDRLCSASIKKHLNLLFGDDHGAAQAARIRIANCGLFDLSQVLATLCREPGSGLSCS